MESNKNTIISVKTRIKAPVASVWKYWTTPHDITRWNAASEDWHTTRAENDLKVGGRFNCRMEAKDGSMGFDFTGVYDRVVINERIDYTLDDGRKVNIRFISKDRETEIIENFEAEGTHSAEMQQTGWQAILDNFKKYAEQKIIMKNKRVHG